MAILIGLDFGDTNIGVALADTTVSLAVPYGIIQNLGYASIVAALEKIITDESATEIIIGLPKSMKNTEPSEQQKKTLAFGDSLQQSFPKMLIRYMDERLSSRQAESAVHMLGRKQKQQTHDAAAAMYILQAYLDTEYSQ